ncbi:hypothetical protein OAM36_03055, partial [Candidatus Pelagibacter sp.]|nr:hypothetical protein [Candidatus Pelagibacter sp.]
MSYRVFIPTAGIGSRLGKITRYINKSLVTVANRPVLSHLIDKFPKNCEFVIALGFKGEIVKEFLELAYPNRKFYFVKIYPFEGPGSGLGKTLLYCKKHLQKPFVFNSCDTIVKENIIPPSYDWMAYASRKNKDSYRTLNIFENKVLSINEKKISPSINSEAYIGLAGINNYSIFWKSMIKGKNQAIKQGEVYGLRSILKTNSIKAKAFIWNDTGSLESLNYTRKIYRKKNEPNILDKEKESIWFVGKSVIKFSSDKKFIKNRILRSRILGSYVPKVVSKRKNMYKYKNVDGKIISEVITLPLFRKLLNECKKFWKKENLSKKHEAKFIKTCRLFY